MGQAHMRCIVFNGYSYIVPYLVVFSSHWGTYKRTTTLPFIISAERSPCHGQTVQPSDNSQYSNETNKPFPECPPVVYLAIYICLIYKEAEWERLVCSKLVCCLGCYNYRFIITYSSKMVFRCGSRGGGPPLTLGFEAPKLGIFGPYLIFPYFFCLALLGILFLKYVAFS